MCVFFVASSAMGIVNVRIAVCHANTSLNKRPRARDGKTKRNCKVDLVWNKLIDENRDTEGFSSSQSGNARRTRWMITAHTRAAHTFRAIPPVPFTAHFFCSPLFICEFKPSSFVRNFLLPCTQYQTLVWSTSVSSAARRALPPDISPLCPNFTKISRTHAQVSESSTLLLSFVTSALFCCFHSFSALNDLHQRCSSLLYLRSAL
jgi:hypothetical protein